MEEIGAEEEEDEGGEEERARGRGGEGGGKGLAEDGGDGMEIEGRRR